MSVMLLTLCILAGCFGFQNAVDVGAARGLQSIAADCMPASFDLPEDATLSDRAGHYRLTLVEVVGNTSKRTVQGSLALITLRPQNQHDSSNRVRTPLFGYTDVDLRSVGAYRVGDPGSQDPLAPGVLVLESDRNGQRAITLRIGSEANRRDVVRYDGAYTVLEVQQISEKGFAGSWRSGLRLSRVSGYFCAVRTP